MHRDVGHLLGIALLVWFWATPIVYASALVQQEFDCGDILRNGCSLLHVLYWLNPLTPIVEDAPRALRGRVPGGSRSDDVPGMARDRARGGAVVSLLLLRFTWGYFFSRSGDFAEEL